MSITVKERTHCLWRLRRMAASLAVAVGWVALLGGGTACRREPEAATVPGAKPYRVGFASFGPDVAADNAIQGYLDGLRAGGIEEGRNLQVVKSHASGDLAQLPELMRSMDARGLDLLVPMTTPGLAAAFTAVRSTPIVFVYTYDPLGAGAGRSFEDHLPRVTGVASFPPIEETMTVLLQLVPKVRKVGTLYNASEANSVKAVGVARAALKARGVALEEVTIGGTGEVALGTQALLARGPDVLWVTGDNTVLQALEGVIKPATSARVPLILNDPEFVERGALAAVGIAWQESGRVAGMFAARVLRGESPAGLPIVSVAQRKVVLNREVARTLGVFCPPELDAKAAQ